MTLCRTTLNNWINGNYSELNKSELIAIANYYEAKTQGYENEIIEDEEGD